MTKMPPPSRSERKAICEPSGEKVGSLSSAHQKQLLQILREVA